MPIDESELITKVTSLQARLYDTKDEMNRITQVLTSLDTILLGADGNPKIDAQTGRPLSQARRQEIYDICMAEGQKIIDDYHVRLRIPPPSTDPPASE